MRNRVAMTDMAALMKGTEADIEVAITGAMREGTERLKQDWRDVIVAAGLGVRLAKTVRGVTFPKAAMSLEPATWVWTKAPKLVDAYDRGPRILPTDGRFYLAIPTKNVPMKRRGKRMTPLDVEVAFNQDLIIRPSRNGNLLAFVEATPSNNRRGFRPLTRGRAARRRVSKLVLMFTLVRQVKVRKRLDLNALANAAQGRWPSLLDRHWLLLPDRTAPLRGR